LYNNNDNNNNNNKYQLFIYSSSDALVSCLKNNIKIYIKTAPTCFGAAHRTCRSCFSIVFFFSRRFTSASVGEWI